MLVKDRAHTVDQNNQDNNSVRIPEELEAVDNNRQVLFDPDFVVVMVFYVVILPTGETPTGKTPTNGTPTGIVTGVIPTGESSNGRNCNRHNFNGCNSNRRNSDRRNSDRRNSNRQNSDEQNSNRQNFRGESPTGKTLTSVTPTGITPMSATPTGVTLKGIASTGKTPVGFAIFWWLLVTGFKEQWMSSSLHQMLGAAKSCCKIENSVSAATVGAVGVMIDSACGNRG